jgi:hypothetical protein
MAKMFLLVGDRAAPTTAAAENHSSRGLERPRSAAKPPQAPIMAAEASLRRDGNFNAGGTANRIAAGSILAGRCDTRRWG